MAGMLDGQTALVTGAGRGFGRAIATRLAREGAAVAVTSRNRAELDSVVFEIEREGGRAFAAPGDVTDPAEVARIARSSEAALGPIELLVSNAGVPGPFGPIWEVDPEAWWRAQAVHIRAPMLLLHEIMPGMIERGRGRAVMVSAIASRLVAAHLSAYCTGKIALNRIVAEAAVESAGKGVALFAIDPGFVFTRLAEDTRSSPDAQVWLPQMVERLNRQKTTPGSDGDLARCAQRVVDLFSGRYDALSGKYMELPDDLDAMLRAVEAEKARATA